ncbi:hypothetical protein ACFR9U_16050 [Halorientalis brevis]|uniref:Uncharacterized protein n=1 Tax=Halorientalis brevis TaxID=1126241 RepID=A0ABD6CGZ7_9EURY|nr:hypothetical protein [Halorientalis brevis]
MGIKKAILNGVEKALEGVFTSIKNEISESIFEPVIQTAFGLLTNTPYPNNIYTFGAPTNGAWKTFYGGIYQDIQLLVAPLFGLVLGLAMFFNIFNTKQQKIALRRAIFVFPFAYSWWWFGGWFLKFNDALADYLLNPAAENMSGTLEGWITTTGSAIFAAVIVYTLGVGVLFTVILIYKLREMAIYAYMLFMPVLLLLWVVPIDSVQGWAKSQMAKFVPLTFMTIPVALLLRIGTELITNTGGLESSIMGLVMFGGAAYAPRYIFKYSSQVSNAVQTGSRTGRAVASGATHSEQRSGGMSGSGGSDRRQVGSFRQAGSNRGSGGGQNSSMQSGRKQLSHPGGVDFSPSMSRRRRRRQRAENLGRAGRTAASKTKQGAVSGVKGAGNRLVESAAKNYYRDESTAKGMGKDALSAVGGTVTEAGKLPLSGGKRAAQGTSKRMNKINRRIKARQQELKEEYDPRSMAVADNQRSILMGDESNSGSDSSSEKNGSQTSMARQTYSRNQSNRTVGSIGSLSNSDSEEESRR